eukprot:2048915-Pyramimonas_sp.AAC.1
MSNIIRDRDMFQAGKKKHHDRGRPSGCARGSETTAAIGTSRGAACGPGVRGIGCPHCPPPRMRFPARRPEEAEPVGPREGWRRPKDVADPVT